MHPTFLLYSVLWHMIFLVNGDKLSHWPIFGLPSLVCPNMLRWVLGFLALQRQWRNVISGGPRFKIFEGSPSRSAKGTSWAPYMHKFSRGSRACSSGKFLNLHSLKCHFLDFGERFYRILMVRKRHCNISEALANVFALSPKPGGPHLAHWGWGPPGSPGLSP
jgi:hypothetical protein